MDDATSHNDEDNVWQQSGLTPSIHHESNEQIVEELTLNDLLGTGNQGPVSNESCVKVKEYDTQDVFIINDPVEPSSLVNGKKNEERGSCSQDAYLYDSSAFDLGNGDDSVFCAFSFNGYHEAPNNDETQGLTIGGNLVLKTTPHPERFMLSSTPAYIEDTHTLGTHSAAQTVPRTLENASIERGDGGINVPDGNTSDAEIWFPVPVYLKKFPKHSSFCPKNEEGASCSQDAYMHDSSLNGKGKEGNTMIPLRNLYEHHESSKNVDSKGVITGGELVAEIMTNTENPVMCLPAPNLNVIDFEGLYSPVVQGILRSMELAFNEMDRKRKWFKEFGDGEGDSSTSNAHFYGSLGRGNEDDGVSPHSGSRQSNAYPD